MAISGACPGITFMGRAWAEPTLLKLAYASSRRRKYAWHRDISLGMLGNQLTGTDYARLAAILTSAAASAYAVAGLLAGEGHRGAAAKGV